MAVDPHPVVCGFVFVVVQHPSAVHLVIDEFALVEGAVFEHEFAFAMLEAVQFIPLVQMPLSISLLAIDKILLDVGLLLLF